MKTPLRPLAERMRPAVLEDYAGQSHLLAPGKPLRMAISQDRLHSMLLWGPPGTGKTTLARLLANYSGAAFQTLSAVLSGVKDIRAAVDQSRKHFEETGAGTVLFVDEVHRFNKSQQDAFLPHIEDGTFIFIGATTENPSFELNNALLSRVRVYVLQLLQSEELIAVMKRALEDKENGLGEIGLYVAPEVLESIAIAADGDARRALNWLEIAADLAEPGENGPTVSADVIAQIATDRQQRFDKKGDAFYEQISALHKSVRGSNPDAALYWFGRMLEGGCDPLYVARRLVRMASEDIGNADPRALEISLNAWQTYERLGSPEGDLTLGQAVAYLAVAPKSNAVYVAYKAARRSARETGGLAVPVHLRNAPTKLMKNMGYGKDYHYAHNEDDGFSEGQSYLPDELDGTEFYQPVNRGLEIKIAEKLNTLRARNKPKSKG